MTNLIINGDFANKELTPWTSQTLLNPIFEPGPKTSAGYSLTIEPGTDVQQLIQAAPTRTATLKWEFSARFNAKAHLGGWLFILISARVGNEFILNHSLTMDLTDDWKTFRYTGRQSFPAEHEGLYFQIISANKVDGSGSASTPILIADISLYETAQ